MNLVYANERLKSRNNECSFEVENCEILLQIPRGRVRKKWIVAMVTEVRLRGRRKLKLTVSQCGRFCVLKRFSPWRYPRRSKQSHHHRGPITLVSSQQHPEISILMTSIRIICVESNRSNYISKNVLLIINHLSFYQYFSD